MVLSFSRGVVLVASAVIFGAGLLAVSAGDPLPGLIVGALGLAGLVIGISERMRYRADIEETEAPTTGAPGGLRPGDALEPRFRRTDEVFLDPTTTRRMRVYLDAATGERRYRAED